MTSLTPIISGLGFAEAPRWQDGKLWFVDYFAGKVFSGDLSGNYAPVAAVEGTPGGLGFLPDGTPLVVSQSGFSVLKIEKDGSVSPYADLKDFCIGAANEMVTDAKGRAYVGHHGFNFFGGAAPEPSTLVMIDTDRSVRKVAEGLIFPNGMAITPDGRTLIVAESFANRLSAFDIQPDGSLNNQRIWAETPGHTPDGICLDADGCVWAGSPLSGTFLRVREGGEIVQTIKTTDERWAVACVFAGADRRTLCCVTAATTLETMPQGKSTAYIETADVGTSGAGRP